MPGPATHIIIVEKQIEGILADPGKFGGPVLDSLRNNRNHAALGSIGPDMIFWADWGGFTPIVETVFDVYQTLDEIYDKLSAIWEPIEDHINKDLDALSGGLSSEIQETVNLLSGVLQAAMTDLITSQIPLLDILKPDLQKKGHDSSEPNWNWLDYTHNRWTGEFTKSLIRRANDSNDSSLRAYAYGWLSHVTADVVGHGYVNTAVGGPWRSHWQRHFIQEKWMDTWVWGFYRTGATMPSTPPIAPGEVPFDYFSWKNLNGSNLHELIDLGTDLPGSVQNLIVQALSDVYLQRPHPNVGGTVPFLGQEEINRAYQMLLKALEFTLGKDRFLTRPEPPSVFGDMTGPQPPAPPVGSGSGTGGSPGGSFSLADLLAAIFQHILDLLDFLHDLALWLISLATYPLTYPIRYGLYLLQMALYDIYQDYRFALAVTGFSWPDPEWLFHPYAQQFINPLVNVTRLPTREWPPEKDNAINFPNSCNPPNTNPSVSCLEQPTVLSGPYTRFPLNYPYWFIQGEPTDPQVEEALITAQTPQETDRVSGNLIAPAASAGALVGSPDYSGSMGNAIDLYLRRAAEIASDNGGAGTLRLEDWNLDADRGYGFKCWRLRQGEDLEPPDAMGGVDIDYL